MRVLWDWAQTGKLVLIFFSSNWSYDEDGGSVGDVAVVKEEVQLLDASDDIVGVLLKRFQPERENEKIGIRKTKTLQA